MIKDRLVDVKRGDDEEENNVINSVRVFNKSRGYFHLMEFLFDKKNFEEILSNLQKSEIICLFVSENENYDELIRIILTNLTLQEETKVIIVLVNQSQSVDNSSNIFNESEFLKNNSEFNISPEKLNQVKIINSSFTEKFETLKKEILKIIT